ncbi:MAG TPA: MarR family transcriptional regulator [Spongiibacteraceae bacterium]|jgi:predicted ArsR family transcriptional regulator|nr:helix-turn-helix domain-containing protein [Spongiibacteraceae bacterium]HUH36472.1 MarR family transcriptional regulator [Spongiibacteraceae bacterium]
MITGLGDTQHAVLDILLYTPEGASVDDLARKLDVTRNAVRQHLAALERDQLIERHGSRPTGRRPEQLYRLSDQGRALFPKQYPLMARLLIERIIQQEGQKNLAKLMRELGRDLALSLQTTAIAEEQIVGHMNRSGYEASVFFRSGGDAEIHAHNCVFHDLAAEYPEVCEFDLAFLNTLSQRDVEHAECIVRQGKRCIFRLEDPATASPDQPAGKSTR